MTSPDVLAQLEIALDELNMARLSLDGALEDAHLSALHSTYTAAIKRILAFNRRTIQSARDLLTILKRRTHQTTP